MPLRLRLGRDNEQLICRATLRFADLYHSLPQMSFPGWEVLAVSCLNTFLSLWPSLLFLSESFYALLYPLWEQGPELHNTEDVGRLSVQLRDDEQTLLPVICEHMEWHLSCTEPWELPGWPSFCQSGFLVLAPASITHSCLCKSLITHSKYCNIFLSHDFPLQRLCSLWHLSSQDFLMLAEHRKR